MLINDSIIKEMNWNHIPTSPTLPVTLRVQNLFTCKQKKTIQLCEAPHKLMSAEYIIQTKYKHFMPHLNLNTKENKNHFKPI